MAGFILQSILLSSQPLSDSLAICGNELCCNNDPTPAGVMISHVHKKNEWMISYRYMNMTMDGLLSGTEKMNADAVFVNYLMVPDKMRMDMHMLMAMYGLSNKVTVMAMFHYNVLAMDMLMFDSGGGHVHPGATGSMNHVMKTSGISDIKLHALFALLKKQRHQLLLSGGINIPSGSIQVKGSKDEMMFPNQRYPYSMQLGSGTWDLQPGINYLYQKGKLTFSTQLNSVIRVGYNTVGYKLGDEVSANSWMAYQWHRVFGTTLRAEAAATGRMDGYDKNLYYFSEPSANPFNYGGKRINCYMGAVLQFKKGILKKQRLGFEYGVPVYQYVNGIQMSQKQSLIAAWSIAF